MRLSLTILATLMLSAWGARLSASDLATASQDGVTTVKADGQLVLEYRSQPNPMKVYVSKWCTPQGIQILRDSPSDHVHHHALMYALEIDKCDFWSEVPPEQYGKQVPAGGMSVSSTSSNSGSEVVIRQAVNWVNTKEHDPGRRVAGNHRLSRSARGRLAVDVGDHPHTHRSEAHRGVGRTPLFRTGDAIPRIHGHGCYVPDPKQRRGDFRARDREVDACHLVRTAGEGRR